VITRQEEVLLRTDLTDLLREDEVGLRYDPERAVYVGALCPVHSLPFTVNGFEMRLRCSDGCSMDAVEYVRYRYGFSPERAVSHLWQRLQRLSRPKRRRK
jgi:hypothetical protein